MKEIKENKEGSHKNIWYGLGRQRIEIPKTILKSRVLGNSLLKHLHVCSIGYYPKAKLVMLTSPMASPQLKAALAKYISAVKTTLNQSGENNIASYFFEIRANGGCGKHPSLAEHQQIANELSAFLKKEMDW